MLLNAKEQAKLIVVEPEDDPVPPEARRVLRKINRKLEKAIELLEDTAMIDWEKKEGITKAIMILIPLLGIIPKEVTDEGN